MKLMVAIPTHDYHHNEFTKCLIRLVQKLESEKIDYEVCLQGGTLVYMARDDLASDAVNRGFDYVLWLDADMTFDDDIFDRLISSGQKLITGVYHGRKPPYGSCIFTKLDPPIKPINYPENMFQIAGCGFGCILTDVSVLKEVYQKYGNCFQPSVEFGEDLEFCKKASSLGYKIYCDPSIQCGHIAQLVIRPNMGNRSETA